jgi:hypothetical protein
MKSAIAMGTIALGFLLLVASGLTASLFPATSTWTVEKAQRAAKVKDRLSNLGPIVNSTRPRMHGGVDPAQLKIEFDSLIKENEQLNSEFESAANGPKTVSNLLKWTGISLAGIGIAGWFAVREA